MVFPPSTDWEEIAAGVLAKLPNGKDPDDFAVSQNHMGIVLATGAIHPFLKVVT